MNRKPDSGKVNFYYRIPRLIRVIVIDAAVIYFIVVLLAYFFQSHLLYVPDTEISATPIAMGLLYEDLTLQTSDSVGISAWFVPAKKSKGVILFCHGNAGNMSRRLGSIQLFHKLGYSTLIFDYRGYGKSAGSPSEKGTYLDAQAAWDYLVNTRKVSPGRIIIFGRSLGGAVAAALAKDNQPAALILESTFTSMPDLAAQLYPFLPARLLCCFSYNTKARVAQMKCPVLVVHSLDDEIVHISHGRELFEAAKQPKRFLELAGGHNESVNRSAEVYTKGLEAFLAEYVCEQKKPEHE